MFLSLFFSSFHPFTLQKMQISTPTLGPLKKIVSLYPIMSFIVCNFVVELIFIANY